MLRIGVLTAVLLTAIVTACSEQGTSPLEPEAHATELTTPLLAPGTPTLAVSERLLRCPVSTTRSASGTIGLLGGSIAVDGHSISLPPGAVVFPTRFTLTVPASDHVQVEIHADGHERFQFLLPASVTMSYERCAGTDIDADDLSVWYISGLAGTLLELMGGSADPEARDITFSTDHLSGFIIAN